jgi:hypothetical protein
MAAVLSATDALRQDRHMSLDDNGIGFVIGFMQCFLLNLTTQLAFRQTLTGAKNIMK